jgi:hypothetical protein
MTVEEIASRERYNQHIASCLKRFTTFQDDEEDELIKQMRRLGISKYKRDTDISQMFWKIRYMEVLQEAFLTHRQKYLLKFNSKHLQASDSQLYSSDTEQSLFAVKHKGQLERDYLIRQDIMFRLNYEFDDRSELCGLKLLNRDLINGVGASLPDDSTQKQ